MLVRPDDISSDAWDRVLEAVAVELEGLNLLDIMGVAAKKKRAREDAAVRMKAREEQRQELIRHLRAMKNRPDLGVDSILKEIHERKTPPGGDVLLLRDAWPLAWKGLVDIECYITCTGGFIPPETRYRVTLTNKGRERIGVPLVDEHWHL